MELLLRAIYNLIFVMIIFIFVKVILSWLPLDRSSRLHEFINTVTEPILAPIRLLVSKSIFGGRGQIFDLSPFITIIILQEIQRYLKL